LQISVGLCCARARSLAHVCVYSLFAMFSLSRPDLIRPPGTSGPQDTADWFANQLRKYYWRIVLSYEFVLVRIMIMELCIVFLVLILL
jgi:hypothetical protein